MTIVSFYLGTARWGGLNQLFFLALPAHQVVNSCTPMNFRLQDVPDFSLPSTLLWKSTTGWNREHEPHLLCSYHGPCREHIISPARKRSLCARVRQTCNTKCFYPTFCKTRRSFRFSLPGGFNVHFSVFWFGDTADLSYIISMKDFH